MNEKGQEGRPRCRARIPSTSARRQQLQEHLHQKITESFRHCFQIYLIFIFGDVPLHFMHIIVIIRKRIVMLWGRCVLRCIPVLVTGYKLKGYESQVASSDQTRDTRH